MRSMPLKEIIVTDHGSNEGLHKFDEIKYLKIKCIKKQLELLNKWKLPDVIIDQHLQWISDIDKINKEWYPTLSALKKLKRDTPFHMRKQLAESFILIKLDYCNTLFENICTYMKNWLQYVQNATASFVLKKYAKVQDVMALKW